MKETIRPVRDSSGRPASVVFHKIKGGITRIAFVGRETFLHRSHLTLLRRLEDIRAMDNVFGAGELIPYSGIYCITHHPPHAGEEPITLAKGNSFPRCVDCGQVSFMLVNDLSNTNRFNHSRDRDLFLETRRREGWKSV